MKPHLVIMILIVIFSGIYFSAFYDVGINVVDEGYLLSPTLRVMQGDIPHKDFVHFYPPGRFYLAGFLFSLFGKNILVIRILFVVVITGSGLLSYFIMKRLTPLWIAVVPSVLIITAPGPLHKSMFTFFTLLLLYLFVRLTPPVPKRAWFFFGLACGAAFYFRQDIPLYIMAAIALTEIPGFIKKPGHKLQGYFSFTGGFLLFVVPLFIYFASHGALKDAAYQLFVAARSGTSSISLPFPSFWPLWPESFTASGWSALFHRLAHYYPPLIYILTVLYLFLMRKIEKPDNIKLMVKILIVGLLVFQQDLIRSDVSHLMQVVAPAHLLMIGLIYRLFDLNRAAVKLIVIPVFISSIALFIFIDGYSFSYPNSILVRMTPLKKVDLGGCRIKIHPILAQQIETTVKHLRRVVKEEEAILALPDIPIFYFLLNKKNVIPYEIIKSGHLRADEELELIEMIRSSNIEYLIFNLSEIDDGTPERRFSRHSVRLWRFLHQHFKSVNLNSAFAVFKRID